MDSLHAQHAAASHRLYVPAFAEQVATGMQVARKNGALSLLAFLQKNVQRWRGSRATPDETNIPARLGGMRGSPRVKLA